MPINYKHLYHYRMYPVGNISFRVLQEDSVLSGYHVPAGVSVITVYDM